MINRDNTTSLKSPADVLQDINKSILKSLWEAKGSGGVGRTLTKRNRDGGITSPDCETPSGLGEQDASWHRRRRAGKGAGHSAETAPRRRRHLTVHRVARGIQCGETVPATNAAGTTGKMRLCRHLRLVPAQPDSRRNADLNVSAGTTKLLKRASLSFVCFLKNLSRIKKLIMAVM